MFYADSCKYRVKKVSNVGESVGGMEGKGGEGITADTNETLQTKYRCTFYNEIFIAWLRTFTSHGNYRENRELRVSPLNEPSIGYIGPM